MSNTQLHLFNKNQWLRLSLSEIFTAVDFNVLLLYRLSVFRQWSTIKCHKMFRVHLRNRKCAQKSPRFIWILVFLRGGIRNNKNGNYNDERISVQNSNVYRSLFTKSTIQHSVSIQYSFCLKNRHIKHSQRVNMKEWVCVFFSSSNYHTTKCRKWLCFFTK